MLLLGVNKMNKYWITAGILNLIASIMHLVMGYADPLVPLFKAGLNEVSLATLLAVWSMATLLMLISSFSLLAIGIYPEKYASNTLSFLWGWLYVAFATIFIVLNLYFGFFSLLQWLLLLPVGILALYGRK